MMLGAVRRVTERLAAAVMLADIRPLSSVRAHVNLEVLQPRERLVASFALNNDIGHTHNRATVCNIKP